MADANDTSAAPNAAAPADTAPAAVAASHDAATPAMMDATVAVSTTTAPSATDTGGDTGHSPEGGALIADADATVSDLPTTPFVAPDFNPTPPQTDESTLAFLDDVELNVKVELGRTEMLIEDVLRLGVGAVVELDKVAGDPVDIYCNDRLVARGEVLVLNDTFCVRVNDIVSPVPEDETQR